MGSRVTSKVTDTYVAKTSPSRVFLGSTGLWVKGGTSESIAYLRFARPFNPRSTIVRAELEMTASSSAGTGTVPLTARIARPFGQTLSKTTWNNRPATGTYGVSASLTRPVADGKAVVFDVTTAVQRWSDGLEFEGFEISTTDTTGVRFYSSYATTSPAAVDLGPKLRVWWSDAPDTPDELSPSGGRWVGTSKPVLRWAELDVNGDTDIVAAQVHLATSPTGFTAKSGFPSPSFDTGAQGVDDASLDLGSLAGVTYSGMSTGVMTWWTVRVKDGAGLWSPWADPAPMRFQAKGTLAIVAPAAGATVSDPTTAVTWALTGDTQRAYRLQTWRKHATLDLWAETFDSGKVTAATTTLTLPKGALDRDDRRYRIGVTVWPVLDRVTTPGVPAAYTTTREVVFDDDAATPSPTSLTVTQDKPFPWARIRWTASVVPDLTILTRDGKILARLDAAEVAALRAPDGSYGWVDKEAPPGREATWGVRHQANGRLSKARSATFATDVKGRWLITDDFVVFLAGREQSLGFGEVSTVYEPVSGAPVEIVDSLRGRSGEVTGQLIRTRTGMSALDGTGSATWRDRLVRLWVNRTPATFVYGDAAVEVTIANLKVEPTGDPRGTDGHLKYDFTFEARPVGRPDWSEYL